MAYLRRFERIIRRKMNGNKKHSTRIGTITWTNNGCLPMKHVLCHRTCKNEIFPNKNKLKLKLNKNPKTGNYLFVGFPKVALIGHLHYKKLVGLSASL